MEDTQHDLSSGKLDYSPYQDKKFQGEIDEEAQRRKWKTFVLFSLTILAALFTIILFTFIGKIYCRYPSEIHTNNVFILGILALIPCFLVISLVKMVVKLPKNHDQYDFHPLVALLKELLTALKK